MQALWNSLKSYCGFREAKPEADLLQNYRLRECSNDDDYINRSYRKQSQVRTVDEQSEFRNAQHRASRLELIGLSGKIDTLKNDTTLVLEKCIDFPRHPGWQSAVNQIEQFLEPIDIANAKFASQRVPNKLDVYR